jgi:hypothetical protein
MQILNINSTNIPLEVLPTDLFGTVKTNINTASVRVYHISGGVEVEDLADTSLVEDIGSNIWRYIWSPVSLPAGKYTAEYTLVDDDTLSGSFTEDLVVGYLESDITTIKTDVELIKNIESGNWKIIGTQMVFYTPANVELFRFNLKDINGVDTNEAVTERTRV